MLNPYRAGQGRRFGVWAKKGISHSGDEVLAFGQEKGKSSEMDGRMLNPYRFGRMRF